MEKQKPLTYWICKWLGHLWFDGDDYKQHCKRCQAERRKSKYTGKLITYEF